MFTRAHSNITILRTLPVLLIILIADGTGINIGSLFIYLLYVLRLRLNSKEAIWCRMLVRSVNREMGKNSKVSVMS